MKMKGYKYIIRHVIYSITINYNHRDCKPQKVIEYLKHTPIAFDIYYGIGEVIVNNSIFP